MRILSNDPRILSMPSRYIQGAGSMNGLGKELKRICKHPLLIIDEFVLSTYGDVLKNSLTKVGLTFGIQPFSGLCVQEKAIEFSTICSSEKHDLVAFEEVSEQLDMDNTRELGAKNIPFDQPVLSCR